MKNVQLILIFFIAVAATSCHTKTTKTGPSAVQPAGTTACKYALLDSLDIRVILARLAVRDNS